MRLRYLEFLTPARARTRAGAATITSASTIYTTRHCPNARANPCQSASVAARYFPSCI